uniref:NADH-ubiquinone oxidoreductase chain 6 n=1 Tax=Helcomeria spinosa TaxID=2813414 RepID=A0A8T9ZY85_9HEMI|nr:NADH dehydrogenase subunit 6 [Helcomeria spinosa]
MMMMLMMMMMMSFTFMWLKHPISMGVTIIMQTTLTAMLTGLLLNSFWYSYIIMIVMLSGMLVLFIYMASVASNEKFNMSIKLIMMSILIMFMAVMMELILHDKSNESINLMNNQYEMMALNNLFNSKTKYITMMIVLYLFFTMITVSKIVNISEGPLRLNKK